MIRFHGCVKTVQSTKSPASFNEYRDTLQSLLRKVTGRRISVNTAGRTGFDFSLNVESTAGASRTRLMVKHLQMPRPTQLPLTTLTAPEDGVRLLSAPRISPRVAELCEQHDWGWYDLSGNCRISLPGLYVECNGNPPLSKPPRPTANLGTPASARVMRTLLTYRGADRTWTHTELQKKCSPGVSLGLVNKVLRWLQAQAFMVRSESGRLTVVDYPGLLSTWGRYYRFSTNRKLLLRTPLDAKQLTRVLPTLLQIDEGGKAAYAAFSSAASVTGRRCDKTWLYVNKVALPEFYDLTLAEEVSEESEANLIVLIPPDDGVFHYSVVRSRDELGRTSHLQTWVDMMNIPGGRESADIIRQTAFADLLKSSRQSVTPHGRTYMLPAAP